LHYGNNPVPLLTIDVVFQKTTKHFIKNLCYNISSTAQLCIPEWCFKSTKRKNLTQLLHDFKKLRFYQAEFLKSCVTSVK